MGRRLIASGVDKGGRVHPCVSKCQKLSTTQIALTRYFIHSRGSRGCEQTQAGVETSTFVHPWRVVNR